MIVKQVAIVAALFWFNINIKRINRYKYSQGCQRFWSKMQEHNSDENKLTWNILLVGLIISNSNDSTEHKKNTQCTIEGILSKKPKGGITGNNLSVIQIFHPIIFATSQNMQVIVSSKCTWLTCVATCFLSALNKIKTFPRF